MARNRALFTKQKEFWSRHKVKIASTFIAIFIWFFVVTGGNYEHITSIPIQTPPTSDDFVISDPIPETARVRVQGQGKALLSFILFTEGRLQLNFEWQAGTQTLYPDKNDIFLTGNAKKLTVRKLISPDSVVLNIEPLVTREIPVQNNASLQTEPGYTLVGDIVVEPEFVRVRGPESYFERLDSVYTETITFDDLKYPLREELNLISPPDPNVKLLNNRVVIGADVQKLMEKRINNIKVDVVNVPVGVNALVIPSQLSVTAQGGVNVVFPLTADDVHAYVVYQAADDSVQHDFPVYIEPIPEVRFRNSTPERFKIVLERITSN